MVFVGATGLSLVDLGSLAQYSKLTGSNLGAELDFEL